MLAALTDRMVEVGLQLHPDKTRIIYCKDGHRRGAYEHTSFTFLGHTFRARRNRSRHGNLFLGFDPAVSKDALKKMGRELRSGTCTPARTWHCRSSPAGSTLWWRAGSTTTAASGRGS
ncbi:hypothetical protein ACFYQ5_12690 [Streptomyces sp. NPDC005794]|uniref:hypothetical protein n=1 Tax=Streptomyces sp. NPDC005794 TaxID=3364733 RepID=UPI00367E6E8C